MDIRDKIIVKQREIIELYTKYFSNFRIPNFWEKEFDGKLHEIASLGEELQEQKSTKRQGVFHVITEGNNNKIYFNGKLIEPDFKCGVPLTMEDYKKLDEIQEKYYEALEQKLPEITDEEIEKWACENTPSGPEADSVIAYKIIGAKAMRDNEIR